MINPQPITRKAFAELLIRLCPENEYPLSQGTPLPLICLSTAGHCFIHQIENEDSGVLRYQGLCLETSGAFDFTAWI